MNKGYALIVALLALGGCVGNDPIVTVYACVTVQDAEAESAGVITAGRTLTGEQAVAFFNATGGPDSGLPVPHEVVMFDVAHQPDFVIIGLFRDGCLYGQASADRAALDALLTQTLGRAI